MASNFDIIKQGFQPGHRLTIVNSSLHSKKTKEAKKTRGAQCALEIVQKKILDSGLQHSQVQEVARLIANRATALENRLDSFWSRLFFGKRIAQAAGKLRQVAGALLAFKPTQPLPLTPPATPPQASSPTPPPPPMIPSIPPPPSMTPGAVIPPPPPPPGMGAVKPKSRLHQLYEKLGSPLEGEKLKGAKKVDDIENLSKEKVAAFTSQLYRVHQTHKERAEEVGSSVEALLTSAAQMRKESVSVCKHIRRLECAKEALKGNEDFTITVSNGKEGHATLLFYAQREPKSIESGVEVVGSLKDFIKNYAQKCTTDELFTEAKRGYATLKKLYTQLEQFKQTTEGKEVERLFATLKGQIESLGHSAKEGKIGEFQSQLTAFSTEVQKLVQIHQAYERLVQAKQKALHTFKQKSGLVEREGKLVEKSAAQTPVKVNVVTSKKPKNGIATFNIASQALFGKDVYGFVAQYGL